VTTLLEAGDDESTCRDLGVDMMILSLTSKSFDALKLCAHFKMTESTRSISIMLVCDPVDRLTRGKGPGHRRQRRDHDTCGQAGAVGACTHADPAGALYRRCFAQASGPRLELSVIDQLTGLYNRRYMMSQLHQLMQRSVMGGQALCRSMMATSTISNR
jgi:two-component system cell cycle response regulator